MIYCDYVLVQYKYNSAMVALAYKLRRAIGWYVSLAECYRMLYKGGPDYGAIGAI